MQAYSQVAEKAALLCSVLSLTWNTRLVFPVFVTGPHLEASALTRSGFIAQCHGLGRTITRPHLINALRTIASDGDIDKRA